MNERRISGLLILTFGLLALYDLTLEWERASLPHILAEFFLGAVAWGWGLLLLKKSWRLKQDLRNSKNQIDHLENDLEHWRTESAKWSHGLSLSIDKQFSLWKLSPAEKEVALLLMKGLELKLVAEVRQTTERTARQQAFNVYQKSGLKGRAELTAFFLEDLLITPQNSPETIHI